MSHVTCHECGSQEHTSGYGLAVGPMGTYTICDQCETLIEFRPDTDDLPDEPLRRIEEWHSGWLAETNAKRAEKGLPLLTSSGTVNPHADHGRGDPENGPDAPDCPCRGTDLQEDCALSGCGFCGVSGWEER